MMLFGCIVAVDSGFATLSLDEGVDPKTYTNTNFGISVRYPVSWLISEGDKESGNRVTDIVTISKQETGYTGDLKITLDPDQSSTLSQYLTDTIDGYEDSHENFEFLDSGTNYVLAGRPAYRIVYTYEGEYSNGENVDMKEMEIGTKVGDDYYYIAYYADTESYPNELSLAEDIIDSFQINQDTITQRQQSGGGQDDRFDTFVKRPQEHRQED